MKYKNLDKVNCINALTNELESIYRQASKALGITDSAMHILYAIYENGDGCLLYDVCRSSGLSKQTINSALRKLEKENILYLKQDKGKSKRVFLTEYGKKCTEETAGALSHAECSAFDSWNEQEINLYLSLLKKYNNSFREQVDKIAPRKDGTI